MTQSSQVPVARLSRGDSVNAVLLVEQVNFKQNRAGKPFLQLMLRDRSGRIRALQWETDRHLYESIRVNNVVRVQGRVEEYQGARQIIVDDLQVLREPEVPWHHFLPRADSDTARNWERLLEEVSRIENHHLRKLLTLCLQDPHIAEALKRAPAGKSLHHAFPGGLLEHIVSILTVARALAAAWRSLDIDLLAAGAVLHDLGKIGEISTDRGFAYTDQGQLLGHVALGLSMLQEKVRAIPDFPAELCMELQHLIVSHHGRVEFGALKEPMTAEAIALHFLDNLDARLSAYFTLVQDEQESPYGQAWTDVNPLFGTRLYRPLRLRNAAPNPDSRRD